MEQAQKKRKHKLTAGIQNLRIKTILFTGKNWIFLAIITEFNLSLPFYFSPSGENPNLKVPKTFKLWSSLSLSSHSYFLVNSNYVPNPTMFNTRGLDVFLFSTRHLSSSFKVESHSNVRPPLGLLAAPLTEL